MSAEVYIHAIRTAVPFHRILQTEIRDYMKSRPEMQPADRTFLDKIYDGSAIRTRHSILDDFLPDPQHESGRNLFSGSGAPGTQKRNDLFAQAAVEGSTVLAREVLSPRITPEGSRLEESSFLAGPGSGSLAPGFGAADITHLITVSCTGFTAPGFDIEVQQQLGMRSDLERIHIGFMGCYATFPALRTARAICTGRPDAKVMILGIEFCSLHFQDGRDKDTLVANALFSDGMAALVVSSSAADSRKGPRGNPLFSIEAAASRMLGGGDSMMAWTIGDTGFLMKLSAYVPRLIGGNIEEVIAGICSRAGIGIEDITEWAVHPGGKAILDRIRQRLDIPETALQDSYKVLAEYGNMSAVTINFVLASLARRLEEQPQGTKGGRVFNKERVFNQKKVFTTAFGPGLTVESAILRPLPPRRKKRYGVHSVSLPLLWPGVRSRSPLDELMDSPSVDETALFRTVRQFDRINRLFSGYTRILKREILNTIRAGDRTRVWTILDLGCGGGDILRWIAEKARKKNLQVRLLGIDADERIAGLAREECRGYPEIQCIPASSGQLEELAAEYGPFDFIISNHVMHHLSGEELKAFIQEAHAFAGRGLVLNDLRRSRLAYIGYTLYAGIFARRSLAFYDGRLSVLRSFRLEELESAVRSIDPDGELEVSRVFPFRLTVRKRAPEKISVISG